MFERMKKESKEEHPSAAPVHERAGAAEKIFMNFRDFWLDISLRICYNLFQLNNLNKGVN
jgi:hypothetical protein